MFAGPDTSERQGWPFGRNVYISELYQVIEETAGVDHVESLDMQTLASDGTWVSWAEIIDVPANCLVHFDKEAGQVTVSYLA